jgi:predicted Zn-dependent peptidase
MEPLAVYGLADDYWQTYRANLESVDPEAVLAAARDLVRPDDLLMLVVGDATRIREEVAAGGFGGVEVVSP